MRRINPGGLYASVFLLGEDWCGPVREAEWDIDPFQVGSSYYSDELQPEDRTAEGISAVRGLLSLQHSKTSIVIL